MDSQAPNEMVYEWLALGNLFSKNAKIKREVTFGDSRFDIYIEDGEKKAFIEVKGVTLENDGVASFPDAPTERGIKHIRELISARERGYDTYIFFVIQMKGVTKFEPSYKNHMEFAKALKEAQDRGVKILAYDSIVTPDEIKIDKPVRVEIE
jgi:sugar fermentation stimulation protein A